MTAERKESASSGDPSLIFLCSASSPSLTSSHLDSATYTREHAEHFWPLYSNADLNVPLMTDGMSADVCTKWKFLPPHSEK